MQDNKQRTPLHHAIMRNHKHIMYELMKKEPNWHIRDIQGASSIHYAFRYCESKMLADIFRHRKIDVDILDDKDLIKVAAAYGHLDIVMQYLEKVSTQTDRSSTIHQFILAAVRCRISQTRRVCMIDEADTPMRKLIISMPDMAYKVLDRCTTMLGADGTKLHKNNFDYEFLEDQFAIRNWMKGKKIIGNEQHSKMNMLPC
ncbi:unnamed protein product [Rotaria sordida]|uniref:Uncharacterized protein n=1 Tax=Rotaria sordida TaxID=392033 RepID=A0A814R2E0_9BILA|nr:unnamed protein product [Rotaria sordida]